ncbi:MAG: peptidylprolyl isomerase [Methylophilaceae bacterium]
MKMNKILISIAAFSAITLTPIAHAADAATVNGKPIKQSWVNFIMKDAQARGQKGKGLKNAVINELIGSELAYQEATKKGFNKKADIITAAEIGRRKLVVNAFLADFMKKNPVSDADTKAAYAQYKKELGDKEYKAQHILVKTEAEAKDILSQVNKGGDFKKLAKEKSLDPGSKAKGGDLGWFPPAGMVKPFSKAVTSLKKGEVVAAPVQTQFGWHVIKLNDTRATKVPTYAKAKEGMKRTLQQRKLEKMMLGLKEKAKIVVPGVTNKK